MLEKFASTRIHLVTRWHSLFPASYSRTSISVPCGFTCRMLPAKIRGFHVPHYCQLVDDLGLPSAPAAQHLRAGSYETCNLTAYLLVQAYQPL